MIGVTAVLLITERAMPIDPTTDLVAADMERIFGPLTGRPELRPFPYHHEVDRTSDANTGRRTMLYATMALLVIAVFAPVFIANRTTSLRAFIQDRVFLSGNRSQAAAVVRSPQLQSVAVRDAVATPSSDFGRVDDPTVGPVPNDTGNDGNPIMPKPMVITSDQASVNPQRPTTSKNAPSRQVSNRFGAAPRVLATKKLKPAPSACPPGSTDNRCIYQDVIYADTTLRVAFNRAKDAGVSEAFLADVGARWQKALQRSLDDPDGTIDRYNQLAATLDWQREDMAP